MNQTKHLDTRRSGPDSTRRDVPPSRFAAEVIRGHRSPQGRENDIGTADGSRDIQELVFAHESVPSSFVKAPYDFLLETFGSKVSPDLIRDSDYIQEQLGVYCAQQMWIRVAEGNLHQGLSPDIKHSIRSWGPLELLRMKDSDENPLNVSQKGLCLVRIMLMLLEQCSLNCLIHADNKSLAYSIKEFLEIAFNHVALRVEVAPTVSWDDAAQSLLTLFAAGTIHILIIPRDAEDVSVPSATTVIRFNVSESQLSYIWARASVRPGGTLIHLIHAGNDMEADALARSTSLDAPLTAWSTCLRSSMDITRPPVALYEGPQPPGEISSDHRQVVDPIAGGTITPSDAVRTVLWLSSTLPSTTGPSLLPLFSHATFDAQYVYKVHLPELLSADISGQPFTNATEARRDACFRVCSQLQVQSLLGTRLFRPPTPMTVPREEGSEQKRDSKYPRRAPLFWERCISTSTRILYPTLLRFDSEGVKAVETGAEGSAIFILTKQPLPALNPFNVYNWGHSLRLEASRAVLNRGAPFEVTIAQLGALHRYTLHACRSISNKRLVCDLDKMPYFLAPVVTPLANNVSDAVIGPLPVLHSAILWSQIDDVCSSLVVPFLLGDLDKAEGYVLQERTSEFSNRFFVKRVRKDLSPLSKPETYTRESSSSSYLEHAEAHSRRFDQVTEKNQPLLEVEAVSTSLNALNPYKAEKSMPLDRLKQTKYLIPQLCSRLTISSKSYRALVFVPAVIDHIGLQLLSIELNTTRFSRSIDDGMLLRALISRAAQMDVDYERLEFFGDAYIKFLTSFYLFIVHPTAPVEHLHLSRKDIICNETLRRCAERVGLPAYTQVKAFASKAWQPTNYTVVPDPPKAAAGANTRDELSFDLARAPAPVAVAPSGKKGCERYYIGDKVLADVLEAIVGAAFISGGQETAIKAVWALGLPLPHLHRCEDLKHRMHAVIDKSGLSLRSGTLDAVGQIFRKQFPQATLLAHALTFGSYKQLEFVGDAVLDLLVVQHVFNGHPGYTEGALTMLKNTMTSAGPLAAICARLGLNRHLHNLPPQMAHAVSTYVAKVEKARIIEYKLAEQEHRRPGPYWADLQAPKVLSDVLEAMVAVLFISDDCRLGGSVQGFFDQVLKPFYDTHVSLANSGDHPTKVLCELTRAYGCHELTFEKQVSSDGSTACTIFIHGNILAGASAQKPSVAAELASTQAIGRFEKTPECLTGSCNCRVQPDNRKAQMKALHGMLREFATSEAEMVRMMPA